MNKDHPGVYFPPPIIYVFVFFAAFFLNRIIPLEWPDFQNDWIYFTGTIFLLAGLFFVLRGVGKFIQSGNTVVTFKAAKSLQESGVYRFTRNPMYLGFTLIYLGFSGFFGNWWHLILLPVLIVIMQEYVIKKEERYLSRKFGEAYKVYRGKVRRWL